MREVLQSKMSQDDGSYGLDIQHLTVAYPGGPPVLADVSFSLRQGLQAALVGANGCGKSTLLNAVAGRLPFQAGSVMLRGQPISSLQSSIASIGADFDLFDYLSPRENARFVLAFMRRPWSVGDYEHLERRYGLDAFDGQRAGSLSRGTRRKVQLVTALLVRPILLLADEPLDGLDEASRALWEEDTTSLAARGSIILSAVHEGSYVARTAQVVLEVENATVATHETPSYTVLPSAGRRMAGAHGVALP